MFTLENFTNGDTELLKDETELVMYRIAKEIDSHEDIKQQYFLFCRLLINHRLCNAFFTDMRKRALDKRPSNNKHFPFVL